MRTIKALYKPNKSEKKPTACKGCGRRRSYFSFNFKDMSGEYCSSCQLQIDNGVDIGMQSVRRKQVPLSIKNDHQKPTCNMCGIEVRYVIKKTGQHAKMCYNCRIKFNKDALEWRKLHLKNT